MSKIEIPVKHFYMLRHGESEANAAKIYSGLMDTPLTKLGFKQANAVAETVQNIEIKPKVIVHSHLQRARDTAKPTADLLNLEMITMEEWAEQDMGEWQGVPHNEVRHFREEGMDPPSGETNSQFKERVANALKVTLEHYTIPLIVCHGGCFRAFSENYGLEIRGIRNTILHEYVPSEDPEKHFPWEVYTYETEITEKYCNLRF